MRLKVVRDNCSLINAFLIFFVSSTVFLVLPPNQYSRTKGHGYRGTGPSRSDTSRGGLVLQLHMYHSGGEVYIEHVIHCPSLHFPSVKCPRVKYNVTGSFSMRKWTFSRSFVRSFVFNIDLPSMPNAERSFWLAHRHCFSLAHRSNMLKFQACSNSWTFVGRSSYLHLSSWTC